MTREEAIERLEDTFEGWNMWVMDNDSPASKMSTALGMAIAALREQEEQSKGCDYCNEYAELPEHCLNDGQNVGRVFDTCIQETNQGWHIELPSSFDIGIRFCPMCGRRLEEV